eukprot:135117-Amorphochlora_amoeboformis.AAC.1
MVVCWGNVCVFGHLRLERYPETETCAYVLIWEKKKKRENYVDITITKKKRERRGKDYVKSSILTYVNVDRQGIHTDR